MSWLSGTATLLGALGGLGGAGASAYGALTGDDNLNTQQVRAPGWARGLQNMFSRAIAQNAFNTAPSFGDFISSGGTARFPTNFTGMLPQEARLLGFVGNAGEPLPYTDINRVGQNQPPSELTPAQRFYLGAQDLKFGRQGPLRNLAKGMRRVGALERKLGQATEYGNLKRAGRLEGKIARTKAKTSDLYDAIMRRGHGTGDQYTGEPQYDTEKRRYKAGVKDNY